MAGNPDIRALLEEMIDTGRTAEEVCRDCPELLAEVRERWQNLRLVDQAFDELLPVPETPQDAARMLAPPLPADLPQVPGYRVEAVLGRGGMGVVYRAWHLRLDRAVALKMLLAGPFARPEERERFLRERRWSLACTTPTSCRFMTLATWTAGRISRWSWSRAATSPSNWQAFRNRRVRPRRWWRRWPTPSTRRTSAASSTATSSRVTSCCRGATDEKRGARKILFGPRPSPLAPRP